MREAHNVHMSPAVDPEHLLTLLAVAESGSESAAAELLGIGQSSVSRRLAALQQSSREPLTVRTAGGVRPTATGERLLPHARAIRAALASSEREIAPAESRPLAFRLGFSQHAALGLAAAFIAGAARGLGGESVAAEYEEASSAALLGRLRGAPQLEAGSARIDAALALASPGSREPGLSATHLGSDDIVLISATSLGRGQAADPESLRKAPLLLPPAGSSVHTRALSALARSGVHPANVTVSPSPAALKSAVLAGAGTGVTIASGCASEVAAGWLFAYRFEETEAVDVWLLVSDHLPPREAVAVRSLARQAASCLSRPTPTPAAPSDALGSHPAGAA